MLAFPSFLPSSPLINTYILPHHTPSFSTFLDPLYDALYIPPPISENSVPRGRYTPKFSYFLPECLEISAKCSSKNKQEEEGRKTYNSTVQSFWLRRCVILLFDSLKCQFLCRESTSEMCRSLVWYNIMSIFVSIVDTFIHQRPFKFERLSFPFFETWFALIFFVRYNIIFLLFWRASVILAAHYKSSRNPTNRFLNSRYHPQIPDFRTWNQNYSFNLQKPTPDSHHANSHAIR